jgi:multidrug efflux pump subunit AcrB
MFSLGGVPGYLFQPLAEAIIFAMLASYVLSRTLVPTLAMYLLKPPVENPGPPRNPLIRAQKAFDRGFERFRLAYKRLLTALVARRVLFIPAFLLVCLSAAALVPWLGQDFFPNIDSGQFILHVRAKTGTRIEDTAMICDLIEGFIRRRIPKQELTSITDNIGLPYSQLNYIYSASGAIGAADADILVSLNAKHRPTADYVRNLRRDLPREFPGIAFYFLPADMTTQILNSGLPAPIDVQIEGQDIQKESRSGWQHTEPARHVAAHRPPYPAGVRLPEFDVTVDRDEGSDWRLHRPGHHQQSSSP